MLNFYWPLIKIINKLLTAKFAIELINRKKANKLKTNYEILLLNFIQDYSN